MIEFVGPPRTCIVTSVAARAQARGVIVLGGVAAITGLGNLVLHPTRFVAQQTIGVGVYAFQCELRFFEVIELGRLPTRWGVALVALDTATARMCVIGRVTRYALRRRVLVAVTEVTSQARHFGMFIAQNELGFVVIEFV